MILKRPVYQACFARVLKRKTCSSIQGESHISRIEKLQDCISYIADSGLESKPEYKPEPIVKTGNNCLVRRHLKQT